jgi:steroid delta-isomerase-like uncharacterized protein
MSSTASENKATFRRTYEEFFNQRNDSIADELVAPDFINHDAPPGRNRGPESMRGLAAWLRSAFPDLHFTVEELVAEGDTVVGRITMSGTHQGPFQGVPAPGRAIKQAQAHFVRFRDGKGIEHRAVRDDLGLMQQLGVIPTPEH